MEHHTTIHEAARAAPRRSARAVGTARCSAPARRPERWTHCRARLMLAICTSGRRPCNNWPHDRFVGVHGSVRENRPQLFVSFDRTPVLGKLLFVSFCPVAGKSALSH